MAQYYLMSQLPSLDALGDNMPLPITEERFLELCRRFLGKTALNELSRFSLMPSRTPEKSSSALIEAWNEGERNLRLVLGKVRAEKMKKTFSSEHLENKSIPTALLQVARTAVEAESPMEAEKFLSHYRLDFLETLRPMDNFSDDSVFYYWIKLKLISRIRQFDADSGTTAYRNIYNSIMNGVGLEAVQ